MLSLPVSWFISVYKPRSTSCRWHLSILSFRQVFFPFLHAFSVQSYTKILTYASFRGRKFILQRFSRFPDTKKYVSLHIFEVCDVVTFLKFASFDARCVANVVRQKPWWAVEVKWSDRYAQHPEELTSLLSFLSQNKMTYALVTSKTETVRHQMQACVLQFIPVACYAYTVGRNTINRTKQLYGL